MACILDYFQILKCYKSRKCYENVTETWFCDMARKCKTVYILLWKWYGVLLKINDLPFVDAVILKKMLGIVFFSVDICTRHRISSKNVDLYMCAPTWHSVSVMGLSKVSNLLYTEISGCYSSNSANCFPCLLPSHSPFMYLYSSN